MLAARTLMGAAGASSGYTIGNSVYADGTSGYLSRTPASAGSRKTWTWSGWVKRIKFGEVWHLFSAGDTGGNDQTAIQFNTGDTLQYGCVVSAATVGVKATSRLFRDPSAWYHVVVAVDITNGTASDRIRVYINGVRETSFSSSTDHATTDSTYINNTQLHTKFTYAGNPTAYYRQGYLANIHFIDGQALTPSSFGETDSVTGSWKPKRYSGTYGTNGFYLSFTNSSSLGDDTSGNGNHFTKSGTVTQTTDSPTDKAASNIGNFCTWNPLKNYTHNTLSQGNLKITRTSLGTGTTRLSTGTMYVSSGKYYWEYTMTTAHDTGTNYVSMAHTDLDVDAATGNYWEYRSDGNKYSAISGTPAAYGSTWTTGDVIGIAVDMDAGKIWFSKNGTWQASGDPAAGTNAAFTTLSGYSVAPSTTMQGGAGTTPVATANFGQTSFTYTPPTGFKRLSTANLPAPTIKKDNLHFNVVTYTGTGSALSVSGVGFQPDFVWIKSRSAATDHAIYDAVRGVQKRLETNNTDAEVTSDGGITSFDSNGFTLGTLAQVNTNTATYVAWCWKANGAGVSNTDGSVTSTVSVNTTARMSIVTFTTPASAGGYTIGHGLGTAPNFIIAKPRAASPSNWHVYHSSLDVTPADNYIWLDLTSAVQTSTDIWNNTAPTSSVFSEHTTHWTTSKTQVAYCFAEVSGFSKFGSYTGNGSADGPFVFCGFRPRWIMVKDVSVGDAGSSWVIWDTTRTPYNVMDGILTPNSSIAEQIGAGNIADSLSNGFKLRTTSTSVNGARTYIFAAFAEYPFGGTGTSQARAR